MKSFVRVVEIWVPTEDHAQLALLEGHYGPLAEFRAASEQMRFRSDECLPGKAWASGHPIILKELEKSFFTRTEVAKAAGLTCGVAMPVFAGDLLTAVVVLFCGDDQAHIGAIELWGNDPATSNEMRLVDGYYGTADTFEFNSRHTKFPRGYGLPGRVWKSNMPLVVKDLDHSRAFLRWEEATRIGINRGLGIPYSHASGQAWVMTFLSARDTPIARGFEIWVPNEESDALIFHSGDCDQDVEQATGDRSAKIGKGEGTIGQAWRSGAPAVRAGDSSDSCSVGRFAAPAGLNAMVALPIMNDRGLKAVIAWYF